MPSLEHCNFNDSANCQDLGLISSLCVTQIEWVKIWVHPLGPCVPWSSSWSLLVPGWSYLPSNHAGLAKRLESSRFDHLQDQGLFQHWELVCKILPRHHCLRALSSLSPPWAFRTQPHWGSQIIFTLLSTYIASLQDTYWEALQPQPQQERNIVAFDFFTMRFYIFFLLFSDKWNWSDRAYRRRRM